MADKEREAIYDYLTARGWMRLLGGWWRRSSDPDIGYYDLMTMDAYREQCQFDIEQIVTALRETGRL